MTDPISATEMAAFDQAWAASGHIYKLLVQSYLEHSTKQAEQGVPGEVTVVSLSQFLVQEWDTDQLASALAFAVVDDVRDLNTYCTDCGGHDRIRFCSRCGLAW